MGHKLSESNSTKHDTLCFKLRGSSCKEAQQLFISLLRCSPCADLLSYFLFPPYCVYYIVKTKENGDTAVEKKKKRERGLFSKEGKQRYDYK